MDTDSFWKLVDASAAYAKGDNDRFLRSLVELLRTLTPPELIKFQCRFDELRRRSYHWDLWGAAYIMQGGCSDDMFDYWRAWLIAQGREVFDEALANAESLARLKPRHDDDYWFEKFLHTAGEVFEEKTGRSIYDELPKPAHPFPANPTGTKWEEYSDDLERRFPKLWKQFSVR
jgi:hypothetical protein